MKQVMAREDRIVDLSATPQDHAKPPLVLLHGATTDPTEMLDIATRASGDYRVFLYSFNHHHRVERLASDFIREITRLKRQNGFRGNLTVVVYSYSAIIFREAVETAADRSLFAGTSLIQLVPTAGGSFLARSMNGPIRSWFVSLASKPSRAENPYGRFARNLWEGQGNQKFYEIILPSRVHTLLVEGDPHSMGQAKDPRLQQHYLNGIGTNIVIIPKSTGVNHDYFPTQPAALEYVQALLKLPLQTAAAPAQPGVGQKLTLEVSQPAWRREGTRRLRRPRLGKRRRGQDPVFRISLSRCRSRLARPS
jgi:pimeloyl-ACP methyl ester carboxylesterase